MYPQTMVPSRKGHAAAVPFIILPPRGGTMLRYLFPALMSMFVCASAVQSSFAQDHPPLRVGIVGLVHGHVHGFLEQYRRSPEIDIVGIAETDRQLLTRAAAKYGFDNSQLFTDLEDMLGKGHPQAVLVY